MPYWVLKIEDVPFTPSLPAELGAKAREVPTQLLGPRPSVRGPVCVCVGAGKTLVGKEPWQCALVILSCSSLQLLGIIHTSPLRPGQAYLFSRLSFSHSPLPSSPLCPKHLGLHAFIGPCSCLFMGAA